MDLPSPNRDLLARLRTVRHDIHQHPELGFEEERTQAKVMAWLEGLGYAPKASAGTGVVADLRPGEPVALALRADLDALPMDEHTDLPYRSVHPGVAHKCGHDGHTSILLGVAELLARVRAELGSNVRLIFQPAEEGVRGGGAKVMVAEGVLDGVPEVYGLHNWPGFAKGELRVAPGPVMAQVDNFELLVRGKGGHGSTPQRCKDPILAASQWVAQIQTVVSRSIGALDQAVVSVGAFQAGRANNVIPGEARLRGTIRSFDLEVRTRIHQRLREISAGLAAATDCAFDLGIDQEYPVLVNDAACAARVAEVACALLGPERVSAEDLPLAASEDFAWFTKAVPGCYFFLGAGRAGEETPGCHHPDFDFDDDLLQPGIEVFLGLVARATAGTAAGSAAARS